MAKLEMKAGARSNPDGEPSVGGPLVVGPPTPPPTGLGELEHAERHGAARAGLIRARRVQLVRLALLGLMAAVAPLLTASRVSVTAANDLVFYLAVLVVPFESCRS